MTNAAGDFASVNLGNFSRERGENIKTALQGKSWMQFNVGICPIGGDYPINITTIQTSDVKELNDMLILCMSGILAQTKGASKCD